MSISDEEIESRFSFVPALSADKVVQIGALSLAFIDIAKLICLHTQPGREQSLALTNLQQAKYWAETAVISDDGHPLVSQS